MLKLTKIYKTITASKKIMKCEQAKFAYQIILFEI